MRSFVIGLIVATLLLLASGTGQTSSTILKLVMCDVGQGDAFLLTLAATQVLIDGGPEESKVLSCLARQMPRWDNTLELVIVTHADSDHIAGLVGVLQQYRVENLLVSHSSKESAVFDRFKELVQRYAGQDMHLITPQKGQVFMLGSEFSATVLHPVDAQPLLQRSEATIKSSLSESSRLISKARFQAGIAGLKPDQRRTKSDLVGEISPFNWQLTEIFRKWGANILQAGVLGRNPQVVIASGQTAEASGHGHIDSRGANLENTEHILQDSSWHTIAQANTSKVDENDGSIVVLFKFHNTTYLFTGDIGGEIELSLLENPLTLGVDVLKTSHHGSKTGTIEELLEVTRPEWALISVGLKNSYGHPHDEVLSRLKMVGSHVLRTDFDGEIELNSDGMSIWLD